MRKRAQGGGDAGADALPVARCQLTEEPCGRIPPRIIAVEQPSPVGGEGQQNPNGLCKRAREMCNRGVDRDHQIKSSDRAGRLAKFRDRPPIRNFEKAHSRLMILRINCPA